MFYRKQRKKKRARAKKATIAKNANEANGTEAALGSNSDESKTNYLSFKHWKQWIAMKTSNIKRGDEGIQLEDCKPVEETALVHTEPGPRRVIIRTKVTTDDQQVNAK